MEDRGAQKEELTLERCRKGVSSRVGSSILIQCSAGLTLSSFHRVVADVGGLRSVDVVLVLCLARFSTGKSVVLVLGELGCEAFGVELPDWTGREARVTRLQLVGLGEGNIKGFSEELIAVHVVEGIGGVGWLLKSDEAEGFALA